MNLKEQLSRFRAWQKAPIHYPDISPKEHTCANCGHHFHGNYCPICQQAAGDGHITWRWVWKNILEVWGLDSQSLPRTLLHLLYRPGHLISDYLSGHRQTCYKPFNMLFIVALAYAVLQQLFGWHDALTPEDIMGDSFLNIAGPWLDNHPAWGAMVITVMMIIPTWAIFRFAPRHPRHTLPEGIFIQLFMSTLMLICTLLSDIFVGFFCLFPIYYYIAYRQLFGYGPWGTLWRLLLCSIAGIGFLTVIVAIIYTAIYTATNHPELLPRNILRLTIVLLIVAAFLALGYFISKKTAQQSQERAL